MAKGTVTYIDGKTVGINTDGAKEGGDGPDKDKLKTDVVVNLRTAAISIDTVKNKVSEVKNGMSISTSGPDHEATSAKVTTQKEATPVPKQKTAPAPVFSTPTPTPSEGDGESGHEAQESHPKKGKTFGR